MPFIKYGESNKNENDLVFCNGNHTLTFFSLEIYKGDLTCKDNDTVQLSIPYPDNSSPEGNTYFIMENDRNIPAVTRHLTELLRNEYVLYLSFSHPVDGGCGC